MNLLVTGGAGFIGANLIEQIIGQDFIDRPDWANGLEIVLTLLFGALVVGLVLAFGARFSFYAGMVVFTAAVASSWFAFSHLRLLIDCAEICQATADAMLRDSAVHKILCSACADICERCVESCNTFRTDARMAACAKTCRSCAGSCQAMAKG